MSAGQIKVRVNLTITEQPQQFHNIFKIQHVCVFSVHISAVNDHFPGV